MSTEGQLYRDNVPHGDNVLAYGNWTTNQIVITAQTDTFSVMYISGVEFIIDDGASITADSFTIATSGDNMDDIVIDSLMKLYALADKSTLKVLRLDGTNDALVGEIRFFPPVDVAASGTFTITPGGTLTMTTGTLGVQFLIRGWQDSEENA